MIFLTNNFWPDFILSVLLDWITVIQGFDSTIAAIIAVIGAYLVATKFEPSKAAKIHSEELKTNVKSLLIEEYDDLSFLLEVYLNRLEEHKNDGFPDNDMDYLRKVSDKVEEECWNFLSSVRKKRHILGAIDAQQFTNTINDILNLIIEVRRYVCMVKKLSAKNLSSEDWEHSRSDEDNFEDIIEKISEIREGWKKIESRLYISKD